MESRQQQLALCCKTKRRVAWGHGWLHGRGLEPGTKLVPAAALGVHAFRDSEQGPELGAPGCLEDQPVCVMCVMCVYCVCNVCNVCNVCVCLCVCLCMFVYVCVWTWM